MSLSKEQMLTIDSLELFGIINKMDHHQFDDYCKTVLAFTESFPVQEIELKNIFNSRDYDFFPRVFQASEMCLKKFKQSVWRGAVLGCWMNLEPQNIK